MRMTMRVAKRMKMMMSELAQDAPMDNMGVTMQGPMAVGVIRSPYPNLLELFSFASHCDVLLSRPIMDSAP